MSDILSFNPCFGLHGPINNTITIERSKLGRYFIVWSSDYLARGNRGSITIL